MAVEVAPDARVSGRAGSAVALGWITARVVPPVKVLIGNLEEIVTVGCKSTNYKGKEHDSVHCLVKKRREEKIKFGGCLKVVVGGSRCLLSVLWCSWVCLIDFLILKRIVRVWML